MKRILKWIGKIALAGIIGLILFILLDLVMWFFLPERGWAPWKWESSGPVAVGNNYSIELLTRTAHIFLAEYDQGLVVYGGTPRDGEKKGTIDLHENTGGRTHILLYSNPTQNGDFVILKDRFGTHRVNLGTLRIEEQLDQENPGRNTFIGTMSGETYPLKFVPPSVWSEVEVSKKMDRPHSASPDRG
jgi:hypothetical protein